VKDFFGESLGGSPDKSALGNVLSTWKIEQKKSSKFLFAAIAVIGGLLITFFMYFDHLVPFLKKIPSIVIYGLIFLLSPLLNFFTGKSKDQDWTLYENGYTVLYRGKSGGGQEKIGFWRDFTSCTYDKNGVKLVSQNPFKKGIKIRTKGNVTEVYSIARERISMAVAQKLDKAVKVPSRPNTPEQRKLHRAEMKTQRAHQADKDAWKQNYGFSSEPKGKRNSGLG
jgi:hypothetical protein